MTPPAVTHGRPSPRTLEEAIRETTDWLDEELLWHDKNELTLILRNQISILEALRGMQVIQRGPR